jgi:hypothetical protein
VKAAYMSDVKCERVNNVALLIRRSYGNQKELNNFVNGE